MIVGSSSGGAWSYPDLLAILGDPQHAEHLEMNAWVESLTGSPFDPEHFDPTEAVFSDPKERLGIILGEN